jgi:phosphoribosylanthranilate isomerase
MSGIDAVQLHGRESPSYVHELRSLIDAEIILALPCNERFVPLEVFGFVPVSILLDSYSNGKFGGTGETFNWERAKLIPDITPCLYLAGGLTPENVAEAVEKVRPHFVDVASGVESSPGKKDPEKLEAFIRNAKNA